MDVDVALAPGLARTWGPTVCVVVDELRASTTITTLLDLGCGSLMLTSGLADARRLARTHGSLLAGERRGLKPDGFDVNNSPAELLRTDVRGRSVVLCTTNGTRVLSRLQGMPAVLVGCLANARACAAAAVVLAESKGTGLGIVCAGQEGRFALDDAVAAGVIIARVVEALRERRAEACLTDAASASLRLGAGRGDPLAALRESASGRLLESLGAGEDVELCARVDTSTTVPVLQAGAPLRLAPLGSLPPA